MLLVFFAVVVNAFSNTLVVVKGEELPFNIHPKHVDGEWYLSVRDPAFALLVNRLGGKTVWNNQSLTISHSIFQEPVLLLTEADSPPQYVSVKDLSRVLHSSFYIENQEAKVDSVLYFAPQITDINIEKDTQAGKYQISVTATAEVQFASMKLEDPTRVIFDVQGIKLSENYRPILFKDDTITDIQVEQFSESPPVVRIIMTLNKGAEYSILPRDAQNMIKINVLAGTSDNNKIAIEHPSILSLKSPMQTENKPARLISLNAQEQKNGSGTKTVITMQASDETPFEWRQLKSPDNRVFLDFKNCIIDVPEREINIDSATVLKIRSGQFEKDPPVVRIVADLKNAHEIKIITKNGYQVVLEVNSSIMKADTVVSNGTGVAVKEVVAESASLLGKGRIIVVDAGHGGSDTGALNARGGMVEKNLTLDIAKRLEKVLRKEGFKVILTRKSDVDVLGYKGGEKEELQARVDVANKEGADIFVSIHINASYSSSPKGASVHWYKALDLPLARVINKHIASKSSFSDRGLSRNKFYVVRHTQMPAVLLELGFITNPYDEVLLSRTDAREKLALSIKDGIVEFCGIMAQRQRQASSTSIP